MGRLKTGGREMTRRAVLRFVNGVDYFLSDHDSVVEPEPFDVVYEHDKLQLRSYPPRVSQVGLGAVSDEPHGLPVLFIPPLMIKPLVYDLREGHSFVGTLRAAGFHPYLVDFGNPDGDDQDVSLDTYVLDWMPRAIAAMQADSGRSDYAMVGYCMGGLFALMTAAAHEDPALSAIVTIGSPIDSAKMGLLSFAARLGHGQVDALVSRLGNIPGSVSSSSFKMMMPLRTVTRYADLWMNMWDSKWVEGFESLEAWTSGFLDYPRDAFRQFLHDFMADNQLVEGRMRFGDRVADLRSVTCPVLAFAGVTDKVVPVKAARAALGVLGSTDVRFREVPGGHMGVVAGFRSVANVWEPTIAFLEEVAV